MSSPLISKSKAFALEIIKVCSQVKREKKESVLTNRLVRSGISIGANIREVFYFHGRADFTAKLQIALIRIFQKRILVGTIGWEQLL